MIVKKIKNPYINKGQICNSEHSRYANLFPLDQEIDQTFRCNLRIRSLRPEFDTIAQPEPSSIRVYFQPDVPPAQHGITHAPLDVNKFELKLVSSKWRETVPSEVVQLRIPTSTFASF